MLHAFNVCFLEMFYITYKIIYITGDVGKRHQKETEGLLLLEFSFQVSKNQVKGRKYTVSWKSASEIRNESGKLDSFSSTPLICCQYYLKSCNF